MKYLLLFGAVCILLWLWRERAVARAVQRQQARPASPTSAPKLPTEMVACEVCGVHLPRQEALPGASGLYCSDAHRRQAEGRA